MKLPKEQKQYTLYHVRCYHYKKNKDNERISEGGMTYYFVSAKSKELAEVIATKAFNKDYKKYGPYDEMIITPKKVRLPKFVQLLGDGILRLSL